MSSNVPDEETLRRLVDEGNSSAQIALLYGRSRQAVDYWKNRIGIVPQSADRYSHKDLLPWELHLDHAWDGIAVALRAMSLEQQGGELTQRQRSAARRLREHLEKHSRVVHYDRTDGFILVSRDPVSDAPGDPIRRPKG